MPWRKQGKGYTTAKGGHIKRPSVYEKLRGKGMPKTKAARIANSKGKRKGS